MKPKFTLRDLFWLMIVVGLATGWGIHASLPTKVEKIDQHKIYGFDLVADHLYRETGNLLAKIPPDSE